MDKPAVRPSDRIDVTEDYARCAWARHFNVSERTLREAVQAVGDRALSVGEHLRSSGRGPRNGSSERPSSH